MKFKLKVEQNVLDTMVNFKFCLSNEEVNQSSILKGMIQGEGIRHSQRFF
jgi:hypothetical protein